MLLANLLEYRRILNLLLLDRHEKLLLQLPKQVLTPLDLITELGVGSPHVFHLLVDHLFDCFKILRLRRPLLVDCVVDFVELSAKLCQLIVHSVAYVADAEHVFP